MPLFIKIFNPQILFISTSKTDNCPECQSVIRKTKLIATGKNLKKKPTYSWKENVDPAVLTVVSRAFPRDQITRWGTVSWGPFILRNALGLLAVINHTEDLQGDVQCNFIQKSRRKEEKEGGRKEERKWGAGQREGREGAGGRRKQEGRNYPERSMYGEMDKQLHPCTRNCRPGKISL